MCVCPALADSLKKSASVSIVIYRTHQLAFRNLAPTLTLQSRPMSSDPSTDHSSIHFISFVYIFRRELTVLL
jgi:hypothetical protein